MPRFSIIIPVFNAQKYLNKLIDSIINQTYENYEIIFIDDGSTDLSLEIIKNYATNNEKIFFYHKDNQGPGLARKYGFDKALGELVYFVDSDDFLPNNKVLEDISNIYDKVNFELLLFDRNITKNGKIIETIQPFENIILKEGNYSIDELSLTAIRGGLNTKIFRRELLKTDFFIDSSSYEDFYTSYLYLDKCNSFYYKNECFYTINRDDNNSSLSSDFNCDKLKKAFEILNELYEKINNNYLKSSLTFVSTKLYITYAKTLIIGNINRKELLQLKKDLKTIKKNIYQNNIKKCKKQLQFKDRIILLLLNLVI